MINLRYTLEDGNGYWEEPNRTKINNIDVGDFATRNGDLFYDRSILDLGCGKDPYLRKRGDLGYKKYTGLDNDLRHAPDILGDFNRIPFKDGVFDMVLALQPLPENFDEIKRVLASDGYFILQSGIVMFEKHDMLMRISKCFGNCAQITHYFITVENPNGEIEQTLERVFVVAKKD